LSVEYFFTILISLRMLYQAASREDNLMIEWIRIQRVILRYLQMMILLYS